MTNNDLHVVGVLCLRLLISGVFVVGIVVIAFVCLSVCLFVCLLVLLFECSFDCLFACLCVCLFVLRLCNDVIVLVVALDALSTWC